MDKISTVKKNILYFIENQLIKKVDFFTNTGLSYSNFKGKSLISEISTDKLTKIIEVYPKLNIEWLLTGKGEMLRSAAEKNIENNPTDKKYIASLEKNVAMLEENLKQCREQNKSLIENRKLDV